MKNKLIPLAAAVVLTVNQMPALTVLAQTHTSADYAVSTEAQSVSPRYKYTQGIQILVDPSDEQVGYSITVKGSASVTSISGTMSIYKKNSAGSYKRIYSRKLSSSGKTLNASGTIASQGSGTYKISFSGTVATNTSSETISASMEDSY